MSDKIELQELIYQVKNELLAPNPAQRYKDPVPLFYIDKVELEIAVNIQKTRGTGIQITVLNFAELNASASSTQEHGHVIKVSLSPFMTREEMFATLSTEDQERFRKHAQGLAKGNDSLVGTPE